MRELNASELLCVSGAGRRGSGLDGEDRAGGSFSGRDRGDKGKPDNSNSDKKPQWTNRDFFDFGPASVIGGTLGSFFGPKGNVAGITIGHVIETRDYHKIGENYKEYIDKELKDGLFHND